MSNYWPIGLQSDAYIRKEFSENGFWKEDYKLLLITDKQGNVVGEVDNFGSLGIQGVTSKYGGHVE